MALFRRRRSALDPLVIDPFVAQMDGSPQDNTPGAESAGFEAISRAEGEREARPVTRWGVSISPGPESAIDPKSVIPKAEPSDPREND